MKARVGGILKKFSVIRKDGSVDTFNKSLHNVLNQSLLNSASLWGRSVTGFASYTFYSPYSLQCHNNTRPPTVQKLNGVYSQTGTTISRVSGDDLPAGVFGGGSYVYYWKNESVWANASAQGNASSAPVSKSFEIADNGELYVINLPPGNTTGVINSLNHSLTSANNRSYSYHEGVITVVNDLTFTSQIDTVTREIHYFGFFGANSSNGSWFEPASPITLNPGDMIMIAPGDFVVTYTFDEYQPREFTDCPITGITATGRTQRLLSFDSSEGNENWPTNRIWFLTDANKITIPTDLTFTQANIRNPNTLTPLQTLSATSVVINPSNANNHLMSGQATANVTTTANDVKQILWGSTSRVAGVLEFDTPQTIPSGKTLMIGSRIQIIPEYDHLFAP
jgi:hypothetical protein